jgi:hypothetical protein
MQQDKPEQDKCGDEPRDGAWLSFRLAAEEVERRLGYSWGRAQKTLLDACKRNELRWRNSQEGGPDVFDADLQRWLVRPESRKGKRPRIIAHLAEMFPNRIVPEPVDCQRKALKADLLQRDRSLSPLDEETLKAAIDEYNRSIRNDPNRTVSE